ncbi:hypothetical protein [Bacillus suaedaesalsae]|uniref:DUF2187 domain-containing protein n=1 Tax=Bacillus suaedaesalsae TaxID=2810349 RepID=A0ABS2DJM1_9BACI|nr:hypothetical protein [Bacillus suaedaesalsae]MBM6618210.1 hypothetical protein [Bacillus suaedaesalsae]
MGIRNNHQYCCTCEEIFIGFEVDDEVFVEVVAGPGGSRTIRGTIVEFGDNSVVIDEKSNRITRV